MFVPRNIATIVDQVARQSVGKDWGLYAALLDHWVEIVGQDYARVTTPVKITFPHQPKETRRSGGTLCVRLPKGLAMEFSYKTAQMQQRINGYFGYAAVARITFEPVYGSLPKAPTTESTPDPKALEAVKKGAQTIENEELRLSLESFGAAIVKANS